MTEKMEKYLEFMSELEKLKTVTRMNRTLDPLRPENSAEHSWHTALMAILMQGYLPAAIDINKVVKMILIHDIVEIDTGDTYLYDEEKRKQAARKEAIAAERLFSMLPEPHNTEFLSLWKEFEAKETLEARAAAALDALQPLINHNVTGIGNPRGMTKTKVTEKKIFIKDISTELWELSEHLIEKAVEKGLFLDEKLPLSVLSKTTQIPPSPCDGLTS